MDSGPASEIAALRKQVSLLAAQVERLQQQPTIDMEELKAAAVQSVVDHAISQTEGIEHLNEQVTHLTEQLAAGSGSSSEPKPVPWLSVPADQAPKLLGELATWISAVLPHYGDLVPLKSCWFRHPDVVQQLLDLRQAWNMAYANPEGKVYWATDWHQRHLPHVGDYVRTRLKCTEGKHTTRTSRKPLIFDAGAMQEYSQWWSTDRNPETEPQEPAPPAPASPLR